MCDEQTLDCSLDFDSQTFPHLLLVALQQQDTALPVTTDYKIRVSKTAAQYKLELNTEARSLADLSVPLEAMLCNRVKKMQSVTNYHF